jgi:hypothetical protein
MLVMHPDFLTRALPLAWSVYLPQSSALSKIVGLFHLTMIIAAAGAVWLARREREAAAVAQAFTVAGLAAYASYLAARKGWSYQFLPAKTFLALAVGLALAEWLGKPPRSPLSRLAATVGRTPATAVTLAVMLGVGAAWCEYRFRVHVATGHYRISRGLAARLPPGQSMANLSPYLFPAFPLAEISGQTWASRYSCLWMLPLTWRADLAAFHSPAALVREDAAAAIAEDLRRHRPRFVILDQASAPAVFRALESSAAFVDVWRDYGLAFTQDRIMVFERGTAPARPGS